MKCLARSECGREIRPPKRKRKSSGCISWNKKAGCELEPSRSKKMKLFKSLETLFKFKLRRTMQKKSYKKNTRDVIFAKVKTLVLFYYES